GMGGEADVGGLLVDPTAASFGMLLQAFKRVDAISTRDWTSHPSTSQQLQLSTCAVGGPNALTVHPVTAGVSAQFTPLAPVPPSGIGRASCRERAVTAPVVVSTKVKGDGAAGLMVCPSGV